MDYSVHAIVSAALASESRTLANSSARFKSTQEQYILTVLPLVQLESMLLDFPDRNGGLLNFQIHTASRQESILHKKGHRTRVHYCFFAAPLMIAEEAKSHSFLPGALVFCVLKSRYHAVWMFASNSPLCSLDFHQPLTLKSYTLQYCAGIQVLVFQLISGDEIQIEGSPTQLFLMNAVCLSEVLQ